MTCPKCQDENTKRFGVYGRKRIQRFRCKSCGATFSEDRPKPLDNHYVDLDEAIGVLSLLLEGMSIRAASRITGLHKRTIMSLLVLAGEKAQAVLDTRVQRVRSRYIQMDELWTFVHTKEGHLAPGNPAEWGDAYTWVALDSETKLIISHLVGKRDAEHANAFVRDVSDRITGRCQVTSDGFRPYIEAVEETWGADVDFAQLIRFTASRRILGRTGTAPARLLRSQPKSPAILTKPTFAPATLNGRISTSVCTCVASRGW